MARRRIFGDRAFRRLIKRVPEAARDEIVEDLDHAGNAILAAQKADAPRKTGALAAGLSKRVYRGSMRLRVGLIGKPINRRLYYAAVIQGGRTAQTVNVNRRTSSGMSSYQLRVRAMAAQPFIFSARVHEIRRTLGGRIRTFWDRTLRRAANGVTDA
jgi:hypothetical protein